MMQGITLDFSGMERFVTREELNQFLYKINSAHNKLINRDGLGNEYLGWMDLPTNRDEEEISRIKECASKIQKQADVFIVIGIGGSYLGAKAVIDLFTNTFSDLLPESQRKFPQIIFAGNNISAKYLRNLVEYVEDKDFAINVISKSGTTLEPAVTFRTLRVLLEDIQLENGQATCLNPFPNNKYAIASIVKKGRGDVWIDLEEQESFIIKGENDIKVNVELIIKLEDN